MEGYLQEQTSFGNNELVYALQVRAGKEHLSAEFTGSKITMYVQESLIKDWPVSATVGFDYRMPLTGAGSLHLLLEKDFVCIDATTEDQSDHYENPNKTC